MGSIFLAYCTLGKSVWAIFFGSFLFRQTSTYVSVSLKTRFPYLMLAFLSYIRALRPYSCFSQAHSLMPLLFWQRNYWRGQAYPNKLQPFRALPLSFIPYPRRSLFGILVSSSNVAHFLSQNIHTHTYTSARLASPILPPSSLTYFFLAFFYSRFGQP